MKHLNWNIRKRKQSKPPKKTKERKKPKRSKQPKKSKKRKQPEVWMGPVEHWSLDKPVLQLGEDQITIGVLSEGTQIFGSTGSGKTSGSGRAYRLALLKHGYGGLVLTTKQGERALWEQAAAETGRSADIRIIAPDTPFRFNFMDHPLVLEVENLVDLISVVMNLRNPDRAQSSREPFWDDSQDQMVRGAARLIQIAGEPLTLHALYKMTVSGPRRDGTDGLRWGHASRCRATMLEARQRFEAGELTKLEVQDLRIALDYWLDEYPEMAPQTRQTIVTHFTSMATSLLTGMIGQLFSTNTTITPEASLGGAIIIVDTPIETFGKAGRSSQVIFKHLWQKAMLARDVASNPRPVFLYVDEAQEFITKFDGPFQALAREKRVATVFLTQSLSSYYAELGGGSGRHQVDALISSLCTKIFHRTNDHTTRQWAADLIGKNRQWRTSINAGDSQKDQEHQQSHQHGSGLQESYDHAMRADELAKLRTGGPANNFIVEGIVYRNGDVMRSSGKRYAKVAFPQLSTLDAKPKRRKRA